MKPLSQIRRFFTSNTTEGNVVILVCIFGFIRSALAIITDWGSWSETSSLESRNIVFALLFSIVLLLELQKMELIWARILFGLAFIATMSLHFIITDSLNSYGAYTALTSMILIALVYDGIWAYIIPGIYLVLISSISFYPDLFSSLGAGTETIEDASRWHTNYWLGVTAVSILVYYLKSTYDAHYGRLERVTTQLEQSNKNLESQNKALLSQREELETINQKLGDRVAERTQNLYDKNSAVSNYIKLSTEEIQDPLMNTVKLIRKLEIETESANDSASLYLLLKKSGMELKDTYNSIKQNLENEERISRTDIRG